MRSHPCNEKTRDRSRQRDSWAANKKRDYFGHQPGKERLSYVTLLPSLFVLEGPQASALRSQRKQSKRPNPSISSLAVSEPSGNKEKNLQLDETLSAFTLVCMQNFRLGQTLCARRGSKSTVHRLCRVSHEVAESSEMVGKVSERINLVHA